MELGQTEIFYVVRKHRDRAAVHLSSEQHAYCTYADCEIQEEGGKIVSGLQKQPDGKDRGCQDIDGQEHVPLVGGMCEHRGDKRPVPAFE